MMDMSFISFYYCFTSWRENAHIWVPPSTTAHPSVVHYGWGWSQEIGTQYIFPMWIADIWLTEPPSAASQGIRWQEAEVRIPSQALHLLKSEMWMTKIKFQLSQQCLFWSIFHFVSISFLLWSKLNSLMILNIRKLQIKQSLIIKISWETSDSISECEQVRHGSTLHS